MKRLLTPRKRLALLVAGLGASGLAAAASLHGGAMIGRPLDVRAPLPSAAVQCLAADVFYGETRLSADQVRVTLSRDSRSVRVQTGSAVNEPVVTVAVQTGCGDASVQRHVLLADPPGTVENAPARELVAAMPGRVEPAARRSVTAAIERDPTATPAVRKVQRPERSLAMQVAEAEAPRLRLEGMVIPVPRSPVLRASFDMTAPGGDSTARAAAALLWQALNAQPADVLRMGDRMRALESELASLRNTSARNAAELARVQETLSSTPSFGWLPWLAVLFGGLAAAGAYYVVRSTQLRVSGPVLESDDLARSVQRAVDVELPTVTNRFAAPDTRPQQAPSAATRKEADAERAEPKTFASDPEPLRRGERVVLLGEALQEAGFLVSIGYPAKGVDVLRIYIEETRDASPLAYLELLQLCRDMGDAESVAAAEDDFRRRFIEEPPRVNAAAGLEGCAGALAMVAGSWATPRASEILERLLFCAPEELGGYPSLEAWRDLMCLWQIAKDKEANPESDPMPVMSAANVMSLEELEAIDVERSSQRFGVDFDLNDVPLQHHKVLDLQNIPRLPPVADRSFAMREFRFDRVEEVQEAQPLITDELFDVATSHERRSYLTR